MKLVILGAALSCAILPALAQEPDPVLTLPAYVEEKIELKQPVSAALRREVTLGEITRTGYVITRQDLEKQGALTADEALKYLPGVRTEGTAGGQVGAFSSQILRGASTRQVLILLDGRPLNDLGYFGGFDLSEFSTAALERIEVIPGGASTLYGADAVGGVINLVTRKELKDQVILGAKMGSFGLNGQSLRVGSPTGPVTWSLGYERQRLENNFPYRINTPTTFQGDGFDQTAGSYSAQRQNADVTTNNFDAHLGWQINPTNQLDLDLLWLDKNLGVPGAVPITQGGNDGFSPENGVPNPDSSGGFNSFSPLTRQYTTSILSQLTWRADLGEDSQLVAKVFSDWLTYRFVRFSEFGDGRDDVQRTNFGAQIQHSWSLSPLQQLTYGIDYRTIAARNESTDYQTTTLNYDDRYEQGAVFIQDEIRWTPEFLTVLGVRLDLNSQTSSSLNPSAGLKYQISPTTAFRANYAKSFRAPTLFDSAYVIDSPFFQLLPNPNLKPERGDSFDFGIDQKLGQTGLIRLSYFVNTVSDLNQFVTSFDPVTFVGIGQVVNIGQVQAQGIEASLDVQVMPNVYLGANFSSSATQILEDLDDQRVGNELPFRPSVFNVNISYDHQDWLAGVWLRSVGSFVTNTTNTERLPGYTTVDLKFRAPLNNGLQLNWSVNNIFDTRFEEFPGVPGLGIDTRVGLTWRL